MGSIYWYIPNLIGYTRIILLIVALYYISNDSLMIGGTFYIVSYLLDALDGVTARALNQCSQFGAVLDMVTDRSSSVLLLAHLMHHTNDISWKEYIPSVQYSAFLSNLPSTCLSYLPSTFSASIQSLLFGLLIALDISSHYMHMVASLSSGSTSHKKITRYNGSTLPFSDYLLSWYYESQIVLFLVCAFNEAFFLTLFFQAVPQSQFRAFLAPLQLKCDLYSYLPIVLKATFPIFLLKQVLNLIQLKRAVARLVQLQSAPIKRD